MPKPLTGEQHHAMLESQKKNASKIVPILIVCGLALVGLSFFGGVQYQKSQQSKPIQNLPGMAVQNGGFGGMRSGFNGQRPTSGEVTAVSSSSITVKDQSGSSKTLAITDTTTVTNNRQAGSISDIKVGDTVAIVATGTDATRILLNPNFGNNSPAPTSTQ